MSSCSDDDTNSTKESDSEYNAEHGSHVDMCMQDDMDTLYGIDLDANVDMDGDVNNGEEKDEVEKDEEQGDEEDEDEDDDDGKEPRTIGQGEMVNTSADDADTMADNGPIVVPEQSQEMREHTPWQQPQAPAPRPQTPELHPRPQTVATHPFSGLEDFGFVTLRNTCRAVPTLHKAEAAGNMSDVDVD